MPMVRYEIRNEYSLADPELYRAADKDDPEGLLEGVAMAGLVGVLRQLGDLAEFAAEIFHNLHEEVLATAARGHGLMSRVQQLETEVPSIERAFLSQTDHSSFFYHPGVDWHPNLQIGQNLVTQGDLPRFVMDSYEECRAPPRLFLLDKFDVAGAGACLKRYTDPSFFKVETSGMAATADVQREKKIRKAKQKKWPRWRNGETPDVQPTSHAKLHQLFLEEHVENGVVNPSRRAQLKRRLNGFPFESKPGKSYMEKLLKSPSPDHKVLHEVTLNSSPLMLATNDHSNSGLEIVEFRAASPDRESVGRKRSPPSSPDRDAIMLNPSIYEKSEVPIDDKISESPSLYPRIGTDNISSTKVTGEKVISVDTESSSHGRLTGDHSDGIASEVDNFVDAPSTMESEMDTDSEFKVEGDFTSSHDKNQSLVSDANEQHFHSSSSDSQSTGDSTISDEGNNSSSKEMYSSSSSDTPSTSAENPESEEFSAKGFGSSDSIEIVDTSSREKNVGVDFPVDQHSNMVPDDACPGTDANTNHKSDSEQQTSCLCSNQSIYTILSSDSVVMSKGMSKGPESDEMASSLNDRKQEKNLSVDPLCSPTVSDFESQSGDDSLRSTAGELVGVPTGEIVPSISTSPSVNPHTMYGSGTISSDNQSNVLSVSANDTPGIHTQGESDDEFPKLPEGFPSDYPDIAHDGENIKSAVCVGKYLIDDLDNVNSNISSNAQNCIPSLGKKHEEASPVDVQTVDTEDARSNATMSQVGNFLDWPGTGGDAHEGDAIPAASAVNGNLQGTTGTICGISSNDSEALRSSFPTPEDLEETRGTSDAVEKDVTQSTYCTGQEVPERSESADLESVNGAHVPFSESHSGPLANVPVDPDNEIVDNVLDKLVVDNTPCFEDSGLDELENDNNCLSGSHGEASLLEKVSQTSNTTNDDYPKSEVSDTEFKIDQGLEVVRASEIQSPMEQSDLDKDRETSQKSHRVDDAPAFAVNGEGEESTLQEKNGFPTSQFDQDIPLSGEVSSELSPSLPINHQQMPDSSDCKGDDNSGFTFSLANCQGPTSVSDIPELNDTFLSVSGYPKDPLGSILPPCNPFSGINGSNMGDLPPLPPLPPVQWRMGKLQHSSSSTEGDMGLITPPVPSTSDVSFSPLTASTDAVPSTLPTTSAGEASFVLEEAKHSRGQNAPEITSEEKVEDSCSSLPAIIIPETAPKEDKIENSCSRLESSFIPETILKEEKDGTADLLPLKIETTQQQSISKSEITPAAEEDGVANGNRTVKPPWPRNPLVDNVAALDKSKLRKVAERPRPQIQKVDERDSLLEQIRTKSFNLKPAIASRPSIRGPDTNLRVAAILEKANAIRQAFAGSDEDDDDDSWSDS